jgi:hypothetical protein
MAEVVMTDDDDEHLIKENEPQRRVNYSSIANKNQLMIHTHT